VRIEDVKPPEEQTIAEVFHGYEAFLDGYKARMEVLLDTKYNLKDNQYRHHHPWFGKINSHQWLCLNGLHHQIHLTQIKKIIKKL
ncbi:MAG: hypothetical protein KTR14_09645, partial [Vampirovibrio sp.]|nr:hypothetical protein [Vampirovibrio sp.]